MGPKLIEIDPKQLVIPQVKYREVKDDLNEFQNLKASIALYGVKQPILITDYVDPETGQPHPNKKLLVDGLQRTSASLALDLDKVPAFYAPKMSDDDIAALQCICNERRIPITVTERLDHYKKFIFKHPEMTQADIAKIFCVSQPELSKILKLDSLNDAAKALVESGQIKQSHAFALATLPPELQESEIQNAAGLMGAEAFISRCKQLRKEWKAAKKEGREELAAIRPFARLSQELMIAKLEVAENELSAAAPDSADYTRLSGRVEMAQEMLQVDAVSVNKKKLEKQKKKLEKQEELAEKKREMAEEALNKYREEKKKAEELIAEQQESLSLAAS